MACWCKGACPVIRNVRHLQSRGNGRGAERALKLALIDSPNCVEGNIALAEILTGSNRASFAEPHLQRAFDTGGATPKLALVTAEKARSMTQVPQAIELFKLAVDLAPKDPAAHAGLIQCLEAGDRLDEAEKAVAVAIEQFPREARIRLAKASIEAARGNFIDAIDTLNVKDARPFEILARGRYRDRAGASFYKAAWNDWTVGKARLVRTRKLVWEQEACLNKMGELMAFANKKKMAAIAKAEPWTDYQKPIFVTGFPRSGTTAFESMLSSHPDILAGDELPFLPEVVNNMPAIMGTTAPYPAAMVASSWGENITGFGILRDMYMRRSIARLGTMAEGAERFFTDKMPLNEMHIPLITRLFPSSPIFYVRRHPLDVVVSNFSYYINHGWGYGATPESCATLYLNIDNLVQKYKAMFPGRIAEIRYESFVTNHAGTVDDAFAHLNLKPTPECFEFHKNERTARTISHRQVKEPLYDRSIGRWKNYREQLAPVIEMLKPIIEREGYEL